MANDIEQNPDSPTEQCPGCGNLIHICILTCSCGYVFKKQMAENPGIFNKQNTIAIVKKRASESVTENLKRKEVDKTCKIKKKVYKKWCRGSKNKQANWV